MNFCWLHETALAEMTQEAERAYPFETGGVTLGYVGDTGEPVVMTIVGPGPDASHSRSRFVPDHAWQCTQIDIHFESSGGKWVYLGDWHTHPNGSPYMSWLDRWTLSRIAQHPEARQTNPLMMIGAGGPYDWSWLCHQHVGGWLFSLLMRRQFLHVRSFG